LNAQRKIKNTAAGTKGYTDYGMKYGLICIFTNSSSTISKKRDCGLHPPIISLNSNI
jgi:hypothetical protein